MYGLLFFGSTTAFTEWFDKANGLNDVIIDFKGSRSNDISAIACVNTLSKRYLKLGRPLHLRHLSDDCR